MSPPEGTRAAVESYPLSDVHKDLYAELYDYFKSDTFLGDPLAIADVHPGIRLRHARGASCGATSTRPSATLAIEAEEPMVAHAG